MAPGPQASQPSRQSPAQPAPRPASTGRPNAQQVVMGQRVGPPPAYLPHAQPARQAPPFNLAAAGIVLGVCVVLGIFAPAALMRARVALDSQHPDTATAALQLVMVVVPLVGVTVGSIIVMRAKSGLPLGIAAGVGLVMSTFIVPSFTDYGQVFAGFGLLTLFMYGGTAFGIAALVLAIVGFVTQGWGFIAAAAGVVAAWCAGWGLAALYLLVTLNQQADAARIANEPHHAPGAAFGAVACLLALAALVRRTGSAGRA